MSYPTTEIQSATTPETPTNLQIQDISKPENNEYRLFLSWKTAELANPAFDHYTVYRSIENEENLTLGIESLASIHERAKIFLEKLPQLFPSAQNILIVSQNGMINQFQKIWEPTHEFTPFEFLTILEKNL